MKFSVKLFHIQDIKLYWVKCRVQANLIFKRSENHLLIRLEWWVSFWWLSLLFIQSLQTARVPFLSQQEIIFFIVQLILEHGIWGAPICCRTLSNHCRGPFKCNSIQQGVLVTCCLRYSAPQPRECKYKQTGELSSRIRIIRHRPANPWHRLFSTLKCL